MPQKKYRLFLPPPKNSTLNYSFSPKYYFYPSYHITLIMCKYIYQFQRQFLQSSGRAFEALQMQINLFIGVVSGAKVCPYICFSRPQLSHLLKDGFLHPNLFNNQGLNYTGLPLPRVLEEKKLALFVDLSNTDIVI